MAYDEFLSHVLASAVEGGINHWADTHRYKDVTGAYDSYVTVNAHNGFGWQLVNATTVMRGIHAIEQPDFRINPTIRETIRVAFQGQDASNIDSHCADAIVQAGLFGIVVYG